MIWRSHTLFSAVSVCSNPSTIAFILFLMTIFSINNITKLLGKKHTAIISREEYKVWEKTSLESLFQIIINENDVRFW